MMKIKHVAYEITTARIKGMQVVRGWFVRGQRGTDLNWEYIAEAESREEAIKAAFEARGNENSKYPIYNESGHEILQLVW